MTQDRSLLLNPTVEKLCPRVTFPGGSCGDPEGSERWCRPGCWCGPGAAGSSDRAVHWCRPEGPALQRPAGGCPQQLGLQHTACKSVILKRQVTKELILLRWGCLVLIKQEGRELLLFMRQPSPFSFYVSLKALIKWEVLYASQHVWAALLVIPLSVYNSNYLQPRWQKYD